MTKLLSNSHFGGTFHITNSVTGKKESKNNKIYDLFWAHRFKNWESRVYPNDITFLSNYDVDLVNGDKLGNLDFYENMKYTIFHSPVVLVDSEDLERERSDLLNQPDESLRFCAPAFNNVKLSYNFGRKRWDHLSNPALKFTRSTYSNFCFIFHDEDFEPLLESISDHTKFNPLKLPIKGMVDIPSNVHATNQITFNSTIAYQYKINARRVSLAATNGTHIILISTTDFVRQVDFYRTHNAKNQCYDTQSLSYTARFSPNIETHNFTTTLSTPGDQSSFIIRDNTVEYSGGLNYFSVINNFNSAIITDWLTPLVARDNMNREYAGFSLTFDSAKREIHFNWDTPMNPAYKTNESEAVYYFDSSNVAIVFGYTTNYPKFQATKEIIFVEGSYRNKYTIKDIKFGNWFTINMSIVLDEDDLFVIPGFKFSWDTVQS